MATRDLSSEFLKLRSDAKAKSVRRRNISSISPSEGKSLIRDPDVREWTSQKQALPPLWVDGVSEIKTDLNDIRHKSTF